MISTLKLIKGAVATKNLVPVLTHLHIYDKRIQATNGIVSIDAPFPYFDDLRITVPAQKFIKAAEICKGEFDVNITKAGKLSIKKKKFRALLPLSENESFPLILPTIQTTPINVDILPILRQLEPFISEDASRPWSRSIHFKDGYAYATNNIVIARVPAQGVPNITIPAPGIDELLRVNYPPVSIDVAEYMLIFHLPGNAWIASSLIEEKWPEVEHLIPECNPEPLPDNFLESLQKILPFCEDPKFPVIHLGAFGMATAEGDSQAMLDIGDFPECKFRAEPLMQVAERAYAIDFSKYPAPCPFIGDDGLVGVVVGMR